MADRKRRVPNYPRIIGWSVGLLIIISIIIIILKIKLWDKGGEVDRTVDNNPEFDYETKDCLTLFPVSAYREDDDGVLTVVMFGNDTFSDYDSTIISSRLSKELPCTLINASLPGSHINGLTTDFNYEHSPEDAYTLYGLAMSMCNNDFSAQENNLSCIDEEYRDYYSKIIDKLKTIDADAVDLFLICYDGHDFVEGRNPYNYDVRTDPATMTGAVESAHSILIESFPKSQICYCTPTFLRVIDTQGKMLGADIANYGYGNLPTMIDPIIGLSMEYTDISCIDLFYGVRINSETADEYLSEDNITPNDAGYNLIADRLVYLLEFLNAPVGNKDKTE